MKKPYMKIKEDGDFVRYQQPKIGMEDTHTTLAAVALTPKVRRILQDCIDALDEEHKVQFGF